MDEHQAKVVVAKADYRAALRNLESISEEIHAQRRSLAMGTREEGVGAEGDGSNEEIDNFKMDSDGLSSECNRSFLSIFFCFVLLVHPCVCMFNIHICLHVCFSGVSVN